jgi:hypothetical protein
MKERSERLDDNLDDDKRGRPAEHSVPTRLGRRGSERSEETAELDMPDEAQRSDRRDEQAAVS